MEAASGARKAMKRGSPFVFLDDAKPGTERQILYAEPERIISATDPAELVSAFREIDSAVRDGFHVAGYFSYELGYFLEPRLSSIAPQARDEPLLWFGLFRSKSVFSGQEGTRWLRESVQGRAYAGPLRFAISEENYDEKFRVAQEYIRAGDVYQINLTFPGYFRFCGDPLALYARLRMGAMAGQGAYVFDGTKSILSLSPELFFCVEKNRITAKPMKGTAPRASDGNADAQLRAGLARSEKDRAENLMIVDLIRNDLGRLAKVGSVHANDLFAVESYPTLHQMVSTVDAELRNDVNIEKLVRAVFPCGSVTGAPKIRAMEIIRELEATPRGIYCGAIGAFSPDSTSSFNVAIRTITISDNCGVLGVGSAIVADSERSAEYAECLLKAKYFTKAHSPIGLIETLRYEPKHGFLRVELHLARLKAGAASLDIPFDQSAALHAMDAAARKSTIVLRVRLQLFEDGGLEVTAQPFEVPGPNAVCKYALSEHFVQSEDLLARHKTNWRELYDSERAKWNAYGVDEVLFLNQRGEIAEASASNVFVRIDERLVTPPLTSGALDGCLRRSLIADGSCVEGVLRMEDLKQADAIYFGNSVRELVRGEAHLRR